jgi:aspartyl/asparaginyl-tRNA synthetase
MQCLADQIKTINGKDGPGTQQYSTVAVLMQVMDVIETLFTEIFKGIEESYQTELEAVRQQYPFEPFVMKPMQFTFAEGVKVSPDRDRGDRGK